MFRSSRTSEPWEAGSVAPTSVRRGRRFRRIIAALVVVALALAAARAVMPRVVHWYVNRVLERDPLYKGSVDGIDVHLWRGAYTLKGVRIDKVTGNVPVPLFTADRVDLAIQWDALLHGSVVGRIQFESPELSFVDAADPSAAQSGAGGPWLEMIRDLFPFKINQAVIRDGKVHFHAFFKDPPVDLYLSEVEATVDNLTNIYNETDPLVATVEAQATAMDQAQLRYAMRLDPFSYRPTFQVAVKLTGLEVTKLNALTRAYGAFDFEGGWFDLVVELTATNGQVEGYIKPLFRNLTVITFKDIGKDNPLQLFWEALVGLTAEVFKNRPRDQVATKIPVSGELGNTRWSILEVVGNVLRNAFIRAYLPRLESPAPNETGLRFGEGSILDEPVTDGP